MTNQYKGKTSRHFWYWPLLATFCLFMLPACSGDEEPASDTQRDESGLCQAILRLNVSSFSQDGTIGTRSLQGNTDEDRIKDIWIFQYNAETGESLKTPVFKDNFDSSDIDINLTPNDTGEQSLVCIVANIHEEGWALDNYGNINTELDTYEKLVNHALPINALDPFTESNLGESGHTIPMFGVSKAMAIVSKCYVSIPLVRMFAKVRAYIDPGPITDLGITLQGGGFKFSNIPYYSQIGTIAPEDSSKAATYPSGVNFMTYVNSEIENTNEVTLYVPENLQGKVEGMKSKKTAKEDGFSFPEKAMKVELTVLYGKNYEKKQHTYTIYPGGDMVNDFNVKRNHIYNVNVSITKTPE